MCVTEATERSSATIVANEWHADERVIRLLGAGTARATGWPIKPDPPNSWP